MCPFRWGIWLKVLALWNRCYGLGISRILGTLFQIFGYKNGVVFPDKITTFDVVIINAGM